MIVVHGILPSYSEAIQGLQVSVPYYNTSYLTIVDNMRLDNITKVLLRLDLLLLFFVAFMTIGIITTLVWIM